MNWLLLFVPVAIGLEILAPERHLLVFAASSLALLPLAMWLGRATEQLAERMGEGVGGLLNATFGNAAELIIALVALRAGLRNHIHPMGGCGATRWPPDRLGAYLKWLMPSAVHRDGIKAQMRHGGSLRNRSPGRLTGEVTCGSSNYRRIARDPRNGWSGTRRANTLDGPGPAYDRAAAEGRASLPIKRRRDP